MHFRRSSGILFHPTSLPSHYGIGDLGTAAYKFVDFLVDAGQQIWQILPLGPTGYGNSPYQSPSAFAGNPLLISLDKLVEEGLLKADEIPPMPGHFLIEDRVNYDAVAAFKLPLLRRSFEHFCEQSNPKHNRAFSAFCAEHKLWLDDYALFMAVRTQVDAPWYRWERDVALRNSSALRDVREQFAYEIEMEKYFQYIFFMQWLKLKEYANDKGVQIMGDIPIYVSFDSADVWANPNLFKLDKQGNPTVVAGVPPDYFSPTGQRWGNPIYRWEQMEKNGFSWWINRLRHTLLQVDIIRIDHFRGFESFWEVPADEETAINGKWVKGPGKTFFNKMRDVLGELPIVTEDLGIITPEVEELRDHFKLPGMKVLHFAFGDTAENPYLPHNYTTPNCVVYTGTHDNNTTVGWFELLSNKEREKVQCYIGNDGNDIAWSLIRLALMSIAQIAIIPIQDVLRLGGEARMNTPGPGDGNWEWRLRPRMLTSGTAQGLRTLTNAYGRIQEPEEEEAEIA